MRGEKCPHQFSVSAWRPAIKLCNKIYKLHACMYRKVVWEGHNADLHKDRPVQFMTSFGTHLIGFKMSSYRWFMNISFPLHKAHKLKLQFLRNAKFGFPFCSDYHVRLDPAFPNKWGKMSPGNSQLFISLIKALIPLISSDQLCRRMSQELVLVNRSFLYAATG